MLHDDPALGLVAWRRGQLEPAREYMEEALSIARRVDRQVLVMLTLNNLAVIAIDHGRLEEGRLRLEESLALAREQNGWASVSERLNNLARVSIRIHDLDQARAYAEVALAIDRRHNIQNALPSQLRRLAEILVLQGDAGAARRHAAEALSLAEAQEHLARAELALGNADKAAAHTRAGLEIAAQENTIRATLIVFSCAVSGLAPFRYVGHGVLQTGTHARPPQAQPIGQSLLCRQAKSQSDTSVGHTLGTHSCAPSPFVKHEQGPLNWEQTGEPPHVPPLPQVGVQVQVARLYAWPAPQLGAAPLWHVPLQQKAPLWHCAFAEQPPPGATDPLVAHIPVALLQVVPAAHCASAEHAPPAGSLPFATHVWLAVSQL